MAIDPYKDFLEGKKYPTDLILAIIVSVIATVGAFSVPDGNVVRIILGIPLLLFLPGYTIVAVFWPEKYNEKTPEKPDKGDEKGVKISKGIDNLERIVLSFGLSIAVVSLIGLILNYLPFGITYASSVLSNFIVIVIFCSLAFYRRHRLPASERYYVNINLQIPKIPENKTEKLLVVFISIALVISTCTLAFLLIMPSIGEKYSEFYILDENKSINNYPVNFSPNETASVIVGVVCHEFKEANYSIIVGIENSTRVNYQNNWDQVFNLTSTNSIGRNITIDHGQIFEDTFSFSINNPGRYKIVWQLNVEGVESDYEVFLWIDVNAS